MMLLASNFNSKRWNFGPITWKLAFIMIGKLKFLNNNLVYINQVWYVKTKLHFLIERIWKMLP